MDSLRQCSALDRSVAFRRLDWQGRLESQIRPWRTRGRRFRVKDSLIH